VFPPPATHPDPTPGSARLAAAIALAQEHGTELSDAEISDLVGPVLPSATDRSIDTDAAGHPTPDPAGPDSPENRRARGARFSAEGAEVSSVVLRPVAGLLRFLGLTGSTAYGSPVSDDDLDFMAVVRRGGVWPFLLYAWLAARTKRRDVPDGPRDWCFNLVLDDVEAPRELGRPRGFLIAREALMVRPLRGEEYYRGLLAQAPWIRSEIPALYDRRASASPEPARAGAPAPLAVRAANLALFPVMATYLHLVAIRESARYRAEGRPGRTFRIRTTPGRLSVHTEKFDELDRLWRAAAGAPRAEAR
jgi:hypothetical protein